MNISDGFVETRRMKRERSYHEQQTDKWDRISPPIKRPWVYVIAECVFWFALLVSAALIVL